MPPSVATRIATPLEVAPADPWLASMRRAAVDGTQALASGSGFGLFLATSGGNAPHTFRRGDVAVVFDGVLYGREVLAPELGLSADGVNNDAQLVLEAYLAWGEDAPARLKGIFATCIFDGRNGRIVAARDRVGVYTLLYREQGDRLDFGTTPESFELSPGEKPKVDALVIAGILDRLHPELEQTYFEGIKRVPPGSMLIAQGESRRVVRYWRPPPVGAGAQWVTEDELGQFGQLLEQAVERALSAGPAGIFLSGGLDSVSVAAAAVGRSRAMGLPAPQALSLLFPGEVREEDTQRGVSSQLGMSITTLELLDVVGDRGLIQSALDFGSTSPYPPQNVWLPAYDKLAAIGKERGCKVILTGGGGDEWLTVTPLLAADLISRLDLAGLARFALALQRSFRLPTLPMWRNVVWTHGLKPLLGSTYRDVKDSLLPGVSSRRRRNSVERRLARVPGWLAPDQVLRRRLEAQIALRTAERHSRPSRPGAGGHYFAQMEHSLQHPLFAIDIEEIFESGRRWGVRQHDVYWDADLIEFLYRVPPHLLNRGGRSKGLVREDLARRFPDLGFDRQKKLLSRNFFVETLFAQSADAWRRLGGAHALADMGVVEPRKLDEWVSGVISSRDTPRIDDLWRVLSLETWVRPRA